MQKDEVASAFWRIVQIEELLSDRRRLWSRSIDGAVLDVVFTRSGIWILLDWRTGAPVAFRAAFSPGSLTVRKCSVGNDSLLIDADTRIGRQICEIGVSEAAHVFTFRTVVVPRSYLTFENWSRDIVPLPGAASDGLVHSAAADERVGQMHASVAGVGSFLYVQELPSLAALCGATRATLAHAVGGEWPDVGYVPPRGRKALGPSAGPTVITHAHIAWSDTVPAGSGDAGEQELALLAAIYLESDRAKRRPEVHQEPTPDLGQGGGRWRRGR